MSGTVFTLDLFDPIGTALTGIPDEVLVPPNTGGPSADFINYVSATIQQDFDSNLAANTPGTTPLPAPNNFAFTDLTVDVGSETPGDAFMGFTPGIVSQFLDLTPDNMLIEAAPDAFIRSDTGNDVLIASEGRNILSAGSGINTMVGGSGQDTFLADASFASTSNTILNFGSTDNIGLLGVSLANFTISGQDTLNGLQIDATQNFPVPGTAPIVGQITLQGYSMGDLGSTLILGFSANANGTPFMFISHP